jgi:hypothetical protein
MPSTAWELRLRALTLFIETEGREPSPRATTPGERRLALWLQEQRHAARGGRVESSRLDALRDAALLNDADVPCGAVWLKVASVSEFIAEEGRVPSLERASSVGEKRLASWLRTQLSGPSASSDVAAALREILVASAPERGKVLSAAI